MAKEFPNIRKDLEVSVQEVHISSKLLNYFNDILKLHKIKDKK